jgi:hypothetical protein
VNHVAGDICIPVVDWCSPLKSYIARSFVLNNFHQACWWIRNSEELHRKLIGIVHINFPCKYRAGVTSCQRIVSQPDTSLTRRDIAWLSIKPFKSIIFSRTCNFTKTCILSARIRKSVIWDSKRNCITANRVVNWRLDEWCVVG